MTVEPLDRDLLPTEARELVDSIRVDITDVGERIATAYLGRAWIALGYPDWDALCDAEFEGARLRVPREVRAGLVQSLSDAGLSTRAAAAALGVGQGTVRRDLASGAPSGAPDAGVPDGTPGRPPVVGQDGKRYAPTQPPRPALHVTTTEKTVEEFIADRDTGEVLSVEDWQAAQAVQDFTDSDDDVRRARHVHTFTKLAVQAGEGLPLLDVALLAADIATDPFSEDLFAQATRLRRRLNDWFDALEAARPRGLRVVEGR